MNRKVVIRLIIITIGISIALVSIFAYQLGLDNNPELGKSRLILLSIGLVTILFGSLYWITPILIPAYLQKIINQPAKTETTHPQNNIIPIILLILLSIIVVYVYIWVTTIGRIEKWPSGKNYYWKLTQAFQHGQTYLLEEPNPELAKLEDPYDHHQRKGLEYLWDTTYYDGKYFLYWGPAPAVIGVFVSAITSKPVTDTGLVFSFVIGIALFSALLLYEIYKKFQIPTRVFWGGILASMINVPLIWLLTRPTFYEVSISGGQFFLMAGFYFLFLGFRNPHINLGWLFASSLTFGLSGATRINLLPAIIILTAIILLRIYLLNRRNFSQSISAFTAFLIPLVIIALSLCWYNYIRFGSIFEFGHRYQLTGPALTADYKDISSLNYVLPNTYTYLFRLPNLSADFPFLTVPWIKQNMWTFFIRLPEHYYYTEPVAGILFIIPIIGFTALLLLRLFWLMINGDISVNSLKENNPSSLFSWFGFSLLIYVFTQLFILLIFISSAMRYLVDISPTLIVLSTMFVGYYVRAIDSNPILARVIASLWVFVSFLTVISGFLIGFTGDKNNFLNQNPAVYYQLFEWFSR
ncbi:MAG: hypothetical protein JNM46_08540 [Anaerolineales bacterium]|nr:hypothetical protein [Anaerolineales bacterium]